MVRKIQRTFDWDVLVRCFAAATAIYVTLSAALHARAGHASAVLLGGVSGG
jgi:hypothetical protein